MKKIQLSLALLSTITMLQANNDNNSTTTLADALANGRVSGQIRAGNIYVNPELTGHPTLNSTAIGGVLKYESDKLYGFQMGVAFYTTHAIDALTNEGDDGQMNDELFGENGNYTLLAEAYVNYKYGNLQLRIGRQLIDTPYADSDDIRMTPNTFEALLATYSYEDFIFWGGYLTHWQGPDAGSYAFGDFTEDGDAVALLATTYAVDNLEASLWYYYAEHIAHIFYGDIASNYMLGAFKLTGALQVASQSEIEQSGIDASLYGAKAGVEYAGFTLGFAYNRLIVDETKEYFGGFGGGVGFINMFEMTAGVFTAQQSASGWKATLSYDFESFGIDGLSLTYDYGLFRGDREYEAREHNLILAYEPLQSWDIEFVYDCIDDREQNLAQDSLGTQIDYSLDRVLVRANYNF